MSDSTSKEAGDSVAAEAAAPVAVGRIVGDLLVVSDVHLRGPKDSRCQLLGLLIDQATAGSVKNFLLLGDIFDFCIGGAAYYRKKYAELGAKLEALAAKGTRVLFVEGNHEFSMPAMLWRGVEVVQDEAMVMEAGGVSIAIRHGDLLNAPASYRAFRSVLKSRLVTGTARAVPPRLLEAYALSHAKVSRSRDPYRTLDHKALMEAAERWLEEANARHGIFGHFHVPYAEERKNESGRILSLRSWDQPNYLLFAAGEFSRAVFDRGSNAWLQSTAKPFLKSIP